MLNAVKHLAVKHLALSYLPFLTFLTAALFLAGCQAGTNPAQPTHLAGTFSPVVQTQEVLTAAGTNTITASASPVPPIPSALVGTSEFDLDQSPVVAGEQITALEPLALDPVVTARLIVLGDWSPGDWSPDSAFLPVYTFTADQVAELDLAPEGPLAYPPVRLRFLEASSGQVCEYPRPAQVGADSLAWLPDGAVAVREASGWWSGLPCSGDFQPVADPYSLAPYFSDPGLSPDGRYRASRFFDVREGIVYNETTLTAVDSGEALQTIAWQQEQRLGDWAEAGPGGRWLDSRYFLIPKTSDQGPLLVEANQRIIPVLSEFFGESFTPCTPQACRLYRADAVVDSAEALHLLLQTSDIESGLNSLRLYHGENGGVETLPLAYPWVQPFSSQGEWFMLDQDGNYQSLWFRPLDPLGEAPRLFMEGAREFSWAPQGGAIAGRASQENQVFLVSFPQGELLAAWTTPGYQYASLATWSPQGEALAVLGYAYGGEQDSALFVLNMPAQGN